ncbi:MAG: MarR family winged helix-turn-helix transcriptional regulator [Acidimicrobiales bacterium]
MISDNPDTRRLDPSDYRALARFRRSLRAFLRFSEDAAREAGLTATQHQLLLAIKGAEGPGDPSVSEVAAALQLRLNSAVGLVARAEAAGLLRRRVDPTDGRRWLLRLTGTGEERLAGLSRLHCEELRRFRRDVIEVLADLGQPDR